MEASRQLAEELERKAREAEEAKEKAKARQGAGAEESGMLLLSVVLV